MDFLSIVVLGASGDLAKRKIYPALFTLFNQGFLRDNFKIVGFSRSALALTDFHKQISGYLKSKNHSESEIKKKLEKFLSRCDYISGKYDSKEDFMVLNDHLKENEKDSAKVNRIFYFAIPPNVFIDVSVSIGENAMSKKGWTRVIIEKPFGKDTESSYSLNKELKKIFKEEQIYRIDHYLGKELVQNLMVLRFANLIFEPIWNHNYIHSVQINWKENLTLTGRGGYFDQYGIIRDVMQNHLDANSFVDKYGRAS